MAGLLNGSFPSTFTEEQFRNCQYLRRTSRKVPSQSGGSKEKSREDKALWPDIVHPRVLTEVAEQISVMFADIYLTAHWRQDRYQRVGE